MLDCVGAVAEPGGRTDTLVYRAQLTGPAAIPALRTSYRDQLMLIAAVDLAATVENEPVLPYIEVGHKLADLADVAGDRLGRTVERHRQHVRLGEPQDDPAGQLGARRQVVEARIHEAGEVVERVVDRVVLPVLFLAAEVDVQRGDPDVLEEGRVVRARAEGVDPVVEPLAESGASEAA